MSSLISVDHRPGTALDVLEAPPPSTTTTRPEPPAAPGLFSRLIEYGTRWWRRRSLVRAYADARLVLGERMFAAGIDDGELGTLIAVVDDKIRRAEATKSSTKALRAERKQLLMRLAAAVLEEDAPLPGADNEYSNARRAETALREYEAGGMGCRSQSA